MSAEPRMAPRFGRLGRWLAALVGAGLASMSPAAAQTVAPSAAPVEWVRYAETATSTITGWLQADEEAAIRFRTYLDGTRAAPDQATPPLVLKIWVAADGTIPRAEFTPFAHTEANADLRSLIVGRKLSGAPPRDMRLPVLIAVQLDPAPATATAPDASERGARHHI